MDICAPKPGRLEISFESKRKWKLNCDIESYLLTGEEKANRWELKMKVDSWQLKVKLLYWKVRVEIDGNNIIADSPSQFILYACGIFKDLNSSESECTYVSIDN